MSDMLTKIMALLQGNGGWASDVQRSGVRPDFGLTGAQVLAPQKSQYERTLRPGEQRSSDELRDMLAEVILAAGAAAVPGVGPKGQARPAPGRIRPGAEARFAEWFGKSRAVDKSGKPLDVYHGTDKGFTEFARDKMDANVLYGPGIFTSESPAVASKYAKGSETARPNVIPAHLRAGNPVNLEATVTPTDIGPINNILIARGLDPLPNINNPFANLRGGTKWKDIWHQVSRRVGVENTNEVFKAAGYDSLKYRGTVETGGDFGAKDPNAVWNWVVFDPTQIKSAIGNRGTYSLTNPDIRE